MKDEFVNITLQEKTDIFLKAPMGCGKTTAIVRELKKLNNETKILVISPRRTITATIYGKFKEENVDINNYLNCVPNSNSERLIISPNSLIKLKYIQIYDYVIIDEIMLFLEYIFSNHPKYKKKMLLIISEIFLTCKHLICSDAFLFPKIIDIFKKYRKQNVIFYEFERLSEKKNIFETMEYFDKKLLSHISKCKKTYIFCESKKKAEKIYERIKTLSNKIKILLITADSENKLSILNNPNKSFIKYDFVITSPIILSGFDFNVDYFKKIYGIYNGNTLSTISIFQMSGRIRKAKKCYFINYRKSDYTQEYLSEKKIIRNIDNYFYLNLEFFTSEFGEKKIRIIKNLLSELFIFIEQYTAITKGKFNEFLC